MLDQSGGMRRSENEMREEVVCDCRPRRGLADEVKQRAWLPWLLAVTACLIVLCWLWGSKRLVLEVNVSHEWASGPSEGGVLFLQDAHDAGQRDPIVHIEE